MNKKKGRLPGTKIKFNRCRNCTQKYKGTITSGNEKYTISCKSHCESMEAKERLKEMLRA